MNPKVNFYFVKVKHWNSELELLRKIMLDSGLQEELKWGHPCYTLDGKNVVLLHGFKNYCAMLFMKGALMKDPDKLLVRQTEHVQAPRQIRFTGEAEILKLKTKLNAYIKEAIAVEKKGLKMEFTKTADFPMPDEFKSQLAKSASLKKAFYALTPGRQRQYLLFFSSAKQSKTRLDRIQKHLPRILKGKGIDD